MRGNGSERAVIRAIFLGFRSVEIDVWEKNGALKVTHESSMMKTAVTDWDLDEAIRVIFKYAFALTDSPFIVSVENHIKTV